MSDDPASPELVIPVVEERLQADAVPVVTGGVRVTKAVQTQQEVLEQALRTSYADVKRVKANRVVNGPQPAQRVGNTLIIPVVSEVLRVYKEWVVTEEIHITQHEQTETVQQNVPVNYEEVRIERLDEHGRAVPDDAVAREEAEQRPAPVVLTDRPTAAQSDASRILSSSGSILNKKTGNR
jgi:stress response protein YsnF